MANAGKSLPAGPGRGGARPQGPRAAAREVRESLYREHILNAAERVFAEQDFEVARVQDISRLAGLSMGSIYAIFPGKEQIFASIVERRGGELLDVARSVVAAHPSPVEALDALCAAYVDWFFAHPEFLRMHLRTGASWALQPSEAGNRRALADSIHGIQADLFARGAAAGLFIDEDPAWLSVMFSGMDQAHLSHWVASGMRSSRDEVLARLQRVVRRTFLA